jgi:hypothetical protein
MPDILYNWKRYWCPREGSLNLSDDGYLFDPESKYGLFINQDACSYIDIASRNCLVLLGEPGIGKTTVLDAIAQFEGNNYRTVQLDLGEYSSEDRLFRHFFENEAIKTWLDGSYILSVLIDSLDECRIAGIAKLLSREFARMPIERMRLRITCRTAQWPITLEDALIAAWGKDNVGVYELSPLSKKDVAEAAAQSGISPSDFIDEISRVRAQPLAIKPVSLRFLINQFKVNKHLPSKEATLYLQGCSYLCEESQERQDSGALHACDASHRLVVAQRIAYITIFSGKFAVWTGPQDGSMPVEDVPISALSGTDNCHDNNFEVNEAIIRDTLNTGLFSARGAYRMGWAHQTYAEFLASQYVMSRLDEKQRRSLLFLADIVGADVVPQLSEVAARVASDDDILFQRILETAPDILLRSDVATADFTQRATLLTKILSKCNDRDIRLRDVDSADRLRHLNHPGIAEQLKPFVAEDSFDINSRILAIDTIAACDVDGLQAELIDLALDSMAAIELRCRALNIIKKHIDADIARRIRPLAEDSPEDPDFRIKGNVLRALWPNFLTAEELFVLITPKKRSRLVGAYDIFLGHEVVGTLRSQHMGAALNWVKSQGRRSDLDYRFQKFMDSVLIAAWNQLYEPGVLPLLSDALRERLTIENIHIMGEPGFKDSGFLMDESKRRSLLNEMVSKIEIVDEKIIHLSHRFANVAKPSDFGWLVKNAVSANTPVQAKVWALMCQWNYNWNIVAETDAVLVAFNDSSAIREQFAHIMEPIEIDSPRAQELKDHYLKYRSDSGEREESQPLDPPPALRIQRLLDRYEADETCLWWAVVRELALELCSTNYNEDELWEPDIKALTGWKEADDLTRNRIVDAAKSYILFCQDLRNEWLQDGSKISFEAHAGYQAFRLIFAIEPTFIENLSVDVWGRWGVGLLYYPLNLSDDESKEFHSPIIEQMFRTAPTQGTESLAGIIEREINRSGCLDVVHRVKHVFCPELSVMLKDVVSNKLLGANEAARVLGCLLAQDSESVTDWILELIPNPIPDNKQARDRALGAADALCSPANPGTWPVVWTAICCDSGFGRSLVGRLASFSRSDAQPLGALTDDQIADLYIWMSREFPHNQDPKFDGVHIVGEREDIADWRDQYLLKLLKSRGTVSACNAIKKLISELPHLPWLRFTWLDAIKTMRSQTWQPLLASELLKLPASNKARAVSSGEELLDVIQESLDRLQEQLQGTTPMVQFLWDYQRENKAWCPKDENTLSEFIKTHLQNDILDKGVIVNREVQIRPLRGADPGQQVDMMVDAILPHSNDYGCDLIQVIVETKGCWHRELNTAMESQLVDRYLKENQCRHGLYLVGYFFCSAWDDSDYRKRHCPKVRIDELAQSLKVQAEELSKGGFSIVARVLDARFGALG